MFKKKVVTLSLFTILNSAYTANAEVGIEEANKLKKELTPLGAERAGNKDGSIPQWEGGMTAPVAGPKPGDIPTALFRGETPVTQISVKNMAQFTEKLSDGVQALMKKYPESFRIDVYPSHRTAAAPGWVYDNTHKNAVHCKVKDGGLSIEGCYGGIPFPIPKSGVEVIWNHQLRVEPESKDFVFKNYAGSSDGSRALASSNRTNHQHPYYYKSGSPETWNGDYRLIRMYQTAPPFKAGESLVIRDNVDMQKSRQAWQYLVGQRRVRRAPTVAYDTPDFVTSGSVYFDEVMGFMGSVDRFKWNLIGKKELYIPYNNNAFMGAKTDDVFVKYHLNPDKVRWELHRVWIVEATVASGKRHAVAKRRFYMDEDTWMAVLVDGFDAEGKLWRSTQVLPFVDPAIPAVVMLPEIVYNLQANTFGVVAMINDESYVAKPQKPDTWFTGDALGAEGTR